MVFLHLVLAGGSSIAESNLVDAVRSGSLANVRELLSAGTAVDQRVDRFTPLGLAATRGDLSMVDLLLDEGADPNAVSLNGANSLSMAVRSCRATAELIRRLIDAGADLENRSGVGITPLQFAVQEERTELALQLIDAGADINTLNPYGEGVLNYAIYTRNNRLIRRVLELGVNTDQLVKLFTTVDYDPPGMGDAQAHHSVLCG
ncbi:MAG: ankyrin repeat domain-containing protein [Granulosicoccus sp.]|nr:ankyrin repeat domain-containing protein [Granulosicoccus sp.]